VASGGARARRRDPGAWDPDGQGDGGALGRGAARPRDGVGAVWHAGPGFEDLGEHEPSAERWGCKRHCQGREGLSGAKTRLALSN